MEDKNPILLADKYRELRGKGYNTLDAISILYNKWRKGEYILLTDTGYLELLISVSILAFIELYIVSFILANMFLLSTLGYIMTFFLPGLLTVIITRIYKAVSNIIALIGVSIALSLSINLLIYILLDFAGIPLDQYSLVTIIILLNIVLAGIIITRIWMNKR